MYLSMFIKYSDIPLKFTLIKQMYLRVHCCIKL